MTQLVTMVKAMTPGPRPASPVDKFIALAFLGMVDLFIPFSEMEHVGGFSDLLLPVNRRKYPRAGAPWPWPASA